MKKKSITLLLAGAVLTAALTGCGASGSGSAGTDTTGTENETDDTDGASAGRTDRAYKVGIVQYVDDASLNQIVAAVQAELDKKTEETGIFFDYKNYTYNGQADATTMNQIAADLIASAECHGRKSEEGRQSDSRRLLRSFRSRRRRTGGFHGCPRFQHHRDFGRPEYGGRL